MVRRCLELLFICSVGRHLIHTVATCLRTLQVLKKTVSQKRLQNQFCKRSFPFGKVATYLGSLFELPHVSKPWLQAFKLTIKRN